MSGGEIFSFLVIAFLSCVVIYTWVRQRRNRELNAWVQNQTVIYDCAVLVRQCMHPGGNWVDWSRSLGGGPRLLIRAGAIEVRAPQGMMLDSRDICLRADTTRMWRDEAGWAGSALGRRECIHLVGRDETAEVELALSPLSNFEEVCSWPSARPLSPARSWGISSRSSSDRSSGGHRPRSRGSSTLPPRSARWPAQRPPSRASGRTEGAWCSEHRPSGQPPLAWSVLSSPSPGRGDNQLLGGPAPPPPHA
jgi:hypothetical protein